MIEWKVKLYNHGNLQAENYYYNTLDAIMYVAQLLKNMSRYDLLDKGTYPITKYDGEEFQKRYLIKSESPEFEIIMFKNTTDSINKESFERLIKEAKILDERDNNSTR